MKHFLTSCVPPDFNLCFSCACSQWKEGLDWVVAACLLCLQRLHDSGLGSAQLDDADHTGSAQQALVQERLHLCARLADHPLMVPGTAVDCLAAVILQACITFQIVVQCTVCCPTDTCTISHPPSHQAASWLHRHSSSCSPQSSSAHFIAVADGGEVLRCIAEAKLTLWQCRRCCGRWQSLLSAVP